VGAQRGPQRTKCAPRAGAALPGCSRGHFTPKHRLQGSHRPRPAHGLAVAQGQRLALPSNGRGRHRLPRARLFASVTAVRQLGPHGLLLSVAEHGQRALLQRPQRDQLRATLLFKHGL